MQGLRQIVESRNAFLHWVWCKGVNPQKQKELGVVSTLNDIVVVLKNKVPTCFSYNLTKYLVFVQKYFTSKIQ